MKKTIFISFFKQVLLNAVLLLGTACTLLAQTEVVFTTSGTFAVPANVNSITVEVIGGGGSGGGNGGGGGGGGAYSKGTFTVTPSSNLIVTIGSGGAVQNADGSATSVGNFIAASGGQHGQQVNNPNIGGGGAGGIGSGGTVNYTGGTGGGGFSTYTGGGGGGAAGPTGNGLNGGNAGAWNGSCANSNLFGGTGGISGGSPAGNGGKGAGYLATDCNTAQLNEVGQSYGGGGGGGNGSGSFYYGKAGANGYCKITYTTTQTEVIFTTSGTFTVPANVNAITVEVIGGGGGGGINGGGGGGGGGYSKGTFTVTPSSNFIVTIGSGGISNSASILDGGTTNVGTLISASGGKHGQQTANPNVGGGGIGGIGTGGTLNYTGGIGGGGYSGYIGGGGGGAAGFSSNGSNGGDVVAWANTTCLTRLGGAAGISGGSPAGNGGKGAGFINCNTGVQDQDPNTSGQSYGGGGGAGNGDGSYTGKAGASGYCKITYTTASSPASTYCLTYKPVRSGNTVDLYVYLLANTAFKLGAGNLQFKYKSTVLSTPTLQSEVLTATTKYSGISLTSPMPVGMPIDESVASLNFNFTGATGEGLSIGTTGDGTQIGVIRFTITDPATSPNIRPYESANGTAMIVYDDNTTAPTLLTYTGSCATYNYPLSTTFAYSAAAFCKSAVAQTPTVTGTSGGTYSSTTGLTLNTSTGQITPSTSTAGTYDVYYNISSAGNGQALARVTINNLPTPTITGLNTIFCANATAVTLAGSPAGGTFTIDGTSATSFNPAALTVAAHTIVYTYTDANTCSATATQSATIYPAPAAITGTPSVNVTFTTTLANAVAGGTWSSGNTAIATVNASTGVVTGVVPDTVTITYSLTNSCGTSTATQVVTVLRNTVQVSLKVLLEGPYSAGLMGDALRNGGTNPIMPLTEPYTGMAGFTHIGGGGGETIANSVLAVSGNNAIVDWVFVELRSKTAPATVLYTRSALIQRDGDIVDTDGTSPLTFLDVIADNFYIAVKHRNHLGFRMAASEALTSTALSLNLTNGSKTTFGSGALKNISSVYFMYSGEGDGNGVINAIDLNSIWLPKNGLNGYLKADFDLNGTVNATDRNEFWLKNNSRIQQLD